MNRYDSTSLRLYIATSLHGKVAGLRVMQTIRICADAQVCKSVDASLTLICGDASLHAAGVVVRIAK
jgi:hypothetical protein